MRFFFLVRSDPERSLRFFFIAQNERPSKPRTMRILALLLALLAVTGPALAMSDPTEALDGVQDLGES